MKFKVGDKVKVIANKYGHGFKIGSVVVIQDITHVDYLATYDNGSSWWVSDEELELA